jgi:transitional endoplasmic reticulum ATPase
MTLFSGNAFVNLLVSLILVFIAWQVLKRALYMAGFASGMGVRKLRAKFPGTLGLISIGLIVAGIPYAMTVNVIDGAVIILCGMLLNFVLHPLLRKIPFIRVLFKAPNLTYGVGDRHAESYSYSSQKPSIKFQDVAGMTELKKQLLEAYGEHQKADKNGILLFGEPGNGKTLIAEALAGELKMNFLPVNIANIRSKWIGQTTEQLRAVFDSAVNQTPCLLFIDEADSVLKDRSNMSRSDSEDGDVVNTFLTKVVDIRRHKGVFVVMATNFPDKLDQAAVRPGRIDFKIEIPNPDLEARIGLLKKFSGGIAFEDGIMERLAKRWEGFSVVTMKSIAEAVEKSAKKDGRKTVNLEQAMAALRTVQGNFGGKLPEDAKNIDELLFDADTKRRLKALASRLSNIDEVERMGGTVPKGILFSGVGGTGKTATAKALAKASGWMFLPTTGASLLNDPEEVDKIFKKASSLRPCIVFIDEADDVLQERSSNPWSKTATNKILAATDGTMPLHDVVFIAATNFSETLDAAAVRGGRFSEHYEFKKPDANTVLAIVNAWMDKKRGTTPFGSDFTPDAVAAMLEGYAPADINDKLQQAVNNAIGRIMAQEHPKQVVLNDLEMVLV